MCLRLPFGAIKNAINPNIARMLPTTRSSEPSCLERCHLYDIYRSAWTHLDLYVRLKRPSCTTSQDMRQIYYCGQIHYAMIGYGSEELYILFVIRHNQRWHPTFTLPHLLNRFQRNSKRRHSSTYFYRTKEGHTLHDRMAGCHETSISNHMLLKHRKIRTYTRPY